VRDIEKRQENENEKNEKKYAEIYMKKEKIIERDKVSSKYAVYLLQVFKN
jgi:hypothetical protein